MREALLDVLEAYLGSDDLWHEDNLRALVARLEAETEATGDPIPAQLCTPFRALLLRLQMGEVPRRLAFELESIVAPRVWKVMEAVRDGLPDGELRTRVEVFNRRLARTFAQDARR